MMTDEEGCIPAQIADASRAAHDARADPCVALLNAALPLVECTMQLHRCVCARVCAFIYVCICEYVHAHLLMHHSPTQWRRCWHRPLQRQPHRHSRALSVAVLLNLRILL